MPTIFEHKNKIYAITDQIEGMFVVTKASWLPNGQKLVEEMRTVEANDVEKVKRLIRLNRYKNFKRMGE